MFKKSKNNKNKIIMLSISAVMLGVALAFITSFTGNRDDVINTARETVTDTVTQSTESPKVTELNDIQPAEIATAVRQRTLTNSPRTVPKTNEADSEPPAVVELELAPVEVTNVIIAEILEENNVQIVPATEMTQTAPPPSEQHTPNSTTYINGQKHTWNPILGWVKSSGDGQVIVMDVESDGEMYEGGW